MWSTLWTKKSEHRKTEWNSLQEKAEHNWTNMFLYLLCEAPPPPRENESQAEGSSHLPRMKQGDGSLIKGER